MERSRAKAAGVFAAASAGLLTGALLLAIPVHAAAVATPVQATVVAQELGDRAAGAFFDQGKMMVAVTDDRAAGTVRSAGAVPQLVKYGQADFDRATAQLAARVKIPGTAWGVDPKANQVFVAHDSTVQGTDLSQLKSVVAGLGDLARLQPSPGVFTLNISGGDPIYSSGGRCSLGFGVRSGSGYAFLTAGHCAAVARYWYSDSGQTNQLGFIGGSSFPGNDYALVTFTGSPPPDGKVNLYNGSKQDITAAADAFVGESVRRSGSTTQVRSGSVTALNVTVNYKDSGQVTGLIATNVCSEKGDSGGPLFDGSKALGLTSGGNGNCSSGGQSFYQPVTEALSAFGVTIF